MNTQITSKQQSSLSIMTIKEVASKIKLIDESATLRWLMKNNIQIHKIAKKNIVYQLDVDCAIEKPFAKNLRKSFPNSWESAYKICTGCETVFKLVVMQLNSTVIRTPQTKVIASQGKEKKLLDRLMK